MTASRPRRMRTGAMTALILVVGIAACSETRGSLGQDCLKSEDCLSSVCSQLKCAAAPVLLDGAPDVDATGAPPDVLDAGSDAGLLVEAAADARADG